MNSFLLFIPLLKFPCNAYISDPWKIRIKDEKLPHHFRNSLIFSSVLFCAQRATRIFLANVYLPSSPSKPEWKKHKNNETNGRLSTCKENKREFIEWMHAAEIYAFEHIFNDSKSKNILPSVKLDLEKKKNPF